MNDFYERIKDIFFQEDQININEHYQFRNYINWDSLTMLSLFSMLNFQYNITIQRQQFQNMNKLCEIYNYIQEKT